MTSEFNQIMSAARYLAAPPPLPGDKRAGQLWRLYRDVTDDELSNLLYDYITCHLGFVWVVLHVTTSTYPSFASSHLPLVEKARLRVLNALKRPEVMEWLKERQADVMAQWSDDIEAHRDPSNNRLRLELFSDWLVIAVINHHMLPYKEKLILLKRIFTAIIGDEGKRLEGWWVEEMDEGTTAFKVRGPVVHRQLNLYFRPEGHAMTMSRIRKGPFTRVNHHHGIQYINRMFWYVDGWIDTGLHSEHYTKLDW